MASDEDTRDSVYKKAFSTQAPISIENFEQKIVNFTFTFLWNNFQGKLF